MCFNFIVRVYMCLYYMVHVFGTETEKAFRKSDQTLRLKCLLLHVLQMNYPLMEVMY